MSHALLNKTLIFATGLAIGSVVTWKVLETKYKKIADEEIASVKEAYETYYGKIEDIAKEERVEDEPDPASELNRFINDLRYTNYSDIPKAKEADAPYVIKPDEYGEFDDYEEISLTYYADDILADDMDELVEDADNVVGLDSLKTFGQYEADSVFVRNDRLKCDFEILRDLQKYTDVTGSSHPEEE